jgi:hypothetical protein
MRPCILNLLEVAVDDGLGISKLVSCQPGRRGNMNGRCEPELRFTVRVGDVNMDARLFPGEEVQAERAISNDCRCHPLIVSEAWLCDHPLEGLQHKGEGAGSQVFDAK